MQEKLKNCRAILQNQSAEHFNGAECNPEEHDRRTAVRSRRRGITKFSNGGDATVTEWIGIGQPIALAGDGDTCFEVNNLEEFKAAPVRAAVMAGKRMLRALALAGGPARAVAVALPADQRQPLGQHLLQVGDGPALAQHVPVAAWRLDLLGRRQVRG